MAKKDIPQGFTVAYIDGAWYPLEAYQLYSAKHPDGFTCINTFCTLDGEDVFFSTQREAIVECQEKARIHADMEQDQWERLVQKSNVYPERCAHYMSIIEERTGRTPIVTHGYNSFSVFLVGDCCPECKHITLCVSARAMAIEDALADVAEEVYEKWCQCKLMHSTYQEELRTA